MYLYYIQQEQTMTVPVKNRRLYSWCRNIRSEMRLYERKKKGCHFMKCKDYYFLLKDLGMRSDLKKEKVNL